MPPRLPSRAPQAWHWADKLGLAGPAMEQPQYNVFERKRVEVEFRDL
jgi:hypothetical protein